MTPKKADLYCVTLNISCMSAANLILFLKNEKIIQISYLCSDTNTTRYSHRFIHVGSFELTNATPVANGCCPAKWTWKPLGSRCENYVMYFLFNSLWPDNIIWRHRSGSALALVMFWCLTAPNHCLSQCWYLISEFMWHSPENTFPATAQANTLCDEFESYTFKITTTASRE